MASHAEFRTYGYIYAIFGIVISIYRVIGSSLYIGTKTSNGPDNSSETKFTIRYYPSAELASMLVTLKFFIILFFGIHTKNTALVKIYKAFHIITSIGLFILLTIGLLVVVGFLTSSSTMLGVAFLYELMILLGVDIAIFFLGRWIINGVIKYINSETFSSLNEQA